MDLTEGLDGQMDGWMRLPAGVTRDCSHGVRHFSLIDAAHWGETTDTR